MKKKRVLKRWVKVTLNIIALATFMLFATWCIGKGLDNYDEAGRQCDEYYGRMCSHYEVEQWSRGVRH